MTTITFTKQDTKRFGFDTIRINGRALDAGRVKRIAKAGSGKWQGDFIASSDDKTFSIPLLQNKP